MKIMRYILIVLGILLGAFFAVAEGIEPCLNEGFRASWFIPDKVFFIRLLIIYIFIGAVSGWGVWFCICGIYNLIKYFIRISLNKFK